MLLTLHPCRLARYLRRYALRMMLVLALLLALLPALRASNVSAYGSASISISDATVVEGDSGVVDMVFTVTRTGDTTSTVVVGYATKDGTAFAGVDYTARSGSITIPSGQSSAEIRVPVIGNSVVQGSRSFSVELTRVENTYGPPVAFAAQQAFAVGYDPMSVVVGDFNGDGKLDLAVVNSSSNTVSVLLNATAPGVSEPVFAPQQAFAVGSTPKSVVAGDFNGDGKLDLAVVNSTSNNVSVLLNATAPGAIMLVFAPQQAFDVGYTPVSMTAGDFNGDGKLDLAAANFDSATVSVLLNATAPGAIMPVFAPQQAFGVGYNTSVSITAGDFNGDGKPDLAVANSTPNNVSVLLNITTPGAATLAFAGQQAFAVGMNPNSVVVGNFNGDGKPDLAVANSNSHTLSVLLNTTTPGTDTPAFASQQAFGVGETPTSVTVGDFNADGKSDLAAANKNSNTLSVLLNVTTPGAITPTFVAQQAFGVDDSPVSVTTGDFNGDGKPDLAAVNCFSHDVSVLLNATASSDGAPDFADRQIFDAGIDPNDVAVGDFNADGNPDLAIAGRWVPVLVNVTAPGAEVSTFIDDIDFSAGAYPISVAIADFNGDGKRDLAVANYHSENVSVLLNATTPSAITPTFAAHQAFGVGRFPISVAVGDFNGDGKPDLAVANSSDESVSVLLNTTAPGASALVFTAQRAFRVAANPNSVAVGDINGDGKPDLATANNVTDSVSVLLNVTPPGVTTPAFATQQTFAVGDYPHSVVMGDFNGDGRPDLAAANLDSNTVSVLLNTTTPGATTSTFTAQQTFGVERAPDTVAVGDFNGDGKHDLAVANFNSHTLSVLLNATTPGATTPAFATQQSYAVELNPDSLAVGDFNGDGKPDLAAASYSGTVSVLLNRAWQIATGAAVGTITDDDAPAIITKTSGDGQSTRIKTAFPTPLTVEVRNAAGRPVEGASVTFSAPDSGPGGSFASSPTLLTDASGCATAPMFTANGKVGSYQVTASTAGGGPFTSFSLMNEQALFFPLVRK